MRAWTQRPFNDTGASYNEVGTPVLGKGARIMSNVATAASGLSFGDIEAYSKRIGDHHNIYDPKTGRADMEKLVSKLKGEIQIREGNESLKVRGQGDFTIYLPLHTSPRRDRFTLGHELGHYFLHYRLAQVRDPEVVQDTFWRSGHSQAETEANVFASGIIMPRETFTAAFTELHGDPIALAHRFDVSPAAAKVRISVLGLH